MAPAIRRVPTPRWRARAVSGRGERPFPAGPTRRTEARSPPSMPICSRCAIRQGNVGSRYTVEYPQVHGSRSRAASCATLGTATSVTSPRRNSRARCTASPASVFTRSPDGRCSLDGIATTHRIPAAACAGVGFGCAGGAAGDGDRQDAAGAEVDSDLVDAVDRHLHIAHGCEAVPAGHLRRLAWCREYGPVPHLPRGVAPAARAVRRRLGIADARLPYP
jgi:hypothetical protein